MLLRARELAMGSIIDDKDVGVREEGGDLFSLCFELNFWNIFMLEWFE